jgi:hypothetical protein
LIKDSAFIDCLGSVQLLGAPICWAVQLGSWIKNFDNKKVGYLTFTSPLIITKLDDSSDIHLSELSHIQHAQNLAVIPTYSCTVSCDM